eukprot:11308620-Karenia_brevis.AAC.1
MDDRDPMFYEKAPSFEDRMFQRHPRKLSDDEFVFLSSRINTRDPNRMRVELSDWVKANARG